MQDLGFPISKSLGQFKSFYGSTSGTAKTLPSLSFRPSIDFVASGSFVNLKLTTSFDLNFASILSFSFILRDEDFDKKFRSECGHSSLISSFAEKLVKEQASVKTDLEIAI
ncbi:myosin heavy chain-like protein [Sesbania bispinosa]|nr:myosin heavy chain-like protein [Sesbania bispinosa]